MKTLVLSVGIFFSLSALAASQASLPMGGEISFNDKEWRLQDLSLKNKKFLLIFHKEKGFQGQVVGGPIKDTGLCEKKSKAKLKTCLNKTATKDNVSYVITTQRFAGKDAYLHHFITFSFPVGKSKEYGPLVEKFYKNLGSGK
jgi:hypothetical protein